MPESYGLHEARQVQNKVKTSIADALYVSGDVVPSGKLWTILAAAGYPSVAETRVVLFERIAKDFGPYPVTVPFDVPLDTVIRYPLLTEGNELRLFPGECLTFRRIAATAGSTVTLYFEFVETDLPFYAYEEPLNQVVNSKVRHGSVYRSTGGLSTGSGSSPGGGEAGRGGRSRGGEPI